MKHITKKMKFVIITAAIIVIGIFSVILFSLQNKRMDVELEANTETYIVTELFYDNSDGQNEAYEVRYYTEKKKSYLTRSDNSNSTEEEMQEISTKYTKKEVTFSLTTTPDSTYSDISAYGDDSDLVYTCSLDVAEQFLSNEILSGTILSAYENNNYYQCYVRNAENQIFRYLFVYNYDKTSGTLIFAECEDNITLPKIEDIVFFLEN